MTKPRGFKHWAGRLHLWLGLALGAVALLSYLPAALYTWEPELTDWYYREYVFVPKAGGAAKTRAPTASRWATCCKRANGF